MIERTATPHTETGTAVEELLGPLTAEQKAKVPEHLHWMGDRSLLRPAWTRVSIVGSRKASPEGRRRAMQLSRDLVHEGVVIVSGLATGIDTAAHTATLDHKGRTIAVLGTSFEECNPAANRELQARIGRDHLLLTQIAPGQRTGKWAFPARNRLMALISDATVIIEAGVTSGTQHQGWEAIRLNTPLFLAQSLIDRKLDWTEMMLDYGARPLASTEDVLGAVATGGTFDPIPF